MPDTATETEALLVLTNAPPADADLLARRCVESGLAACVNLMPAMTSMYRWQGELETAAEQLLLIKTTKAALPALQTVIEAHHPYELPEIISVPLGPSSPRYLEWILANVAS